MRGGEHTNSSTCCSGGRRLASRLWQTLECHDGCSAENRASQGHEKGFTLRSDSIAGAEAPPFTLTFNHRANHATLLGLMPPGERRMSLPCLLHLPDMGTLRITSRTPGLTLVPRDTAGYDEVLSIYRAQVAGLLSFQHSSGLLRIVSEEPTAHLETSGTTMLLCGLATGIGAGLLPNSQLEPLRRGFNGVITWINGKGRLF